MKKYYSKSTNGFYSSEIHGERLIEHITTDPETSKMLHRWHDRNPDCLIPADSVEISEDYHAALLAGQSAGKNLTTDINGRPELTDPPAPTAEELKSQFNAGVTAKILKIESGQARTIREVTLGVDGARDRLVAMDNEISLLRASFKK